MFMALQKKIKVLTKTDADMARVLECKLIHIEFNV